MSSNKDQYKNNSYLMLRIRIMLLIILKGKLSLKKIINMVQCFYAYLFKLETSGRLPIMVDVEMWNECNESCLFCRSAEGNIYDLNPDGPGLPIAKGKLKIDIYYGLVDQIKEYTTMVIPYMNGEPLMYKDIYDAIAYSSKNNLATLIASNGIILNKKNGEKLLAAGLDFLKVHISGFTKEIHNIEHRIGNVETIKKNLIDFVKSRYDGNYRCTILLDYILYNHNAHELKLAQQFAEENGLLFNIRPGLAKGLESTEQSLEYKGPPPIDLVCDFLWKALSINWDGSILPCCEYVEWSGDSGYGKFNPDQTSIEKIWNGELSKKMRISHIENGRRNIDICSGCYRTGVGFKY